MSRNSLITVALGDSYRRQAEAMVASFRRFHDWPVTILSDADPRVFNTRYVHTMRLDAGARLAKLNMNLFCATNHVLYLDADTRVVAPLDAGMRALEAGFDMALAHSANQGDEWLWNCGTEDRDATALDFMSQPVALQAGAVFFNYQTTLRLFAAWREEWHRFRDQDQASLLRALHRQPVALWLFSDRYHGQNGQVIRHLFGRRG